ncbi:hypothetical protein HYH02_010047 [Chlamydomonas schloesseri]|uniref:S-adenosyl-L-methionine-dependent methyltransferase n=1 Tax=Chlamydomonas schloesseri TaxID=2026947 RepID=A0A835T9Q2_9CHLO|nr:hypothetical protein HYH02_010047 [Chlamydomonas schloesseri]|eukprot:KAG2441203.1 hypothetical protein HYH02_010047 [Chlamydomonas schloesseri]
MSAQQQHTASDSAPLDDDAVVRAARAQLTDVEATAVAVSKFRVAAAQLRRPDGSPFFDSSFDAALCNAVLPRDEQAALLSQFQDHMIAVLAVRTAEIDEHVMAAVGGSSSSSSGSSSGSGSSSSVTGGGVKQLVILGAGLDMRAWRLPLEQGAGSSSSGSSGSSSSGSGSGSSSSGSSSGSGTSDNGSSSNGGVTVFELDSGTTESLKTRVLGRAPPPHRCRRAFVQADLEAPEQALGRLQQAGWDPARPSVFVMEGLIGYLTAAAGDTLLRRLRAAAAPGSTLLLTTPPSPSWRDELERSRGVKLHHTTFEESEQTLARAVAAGWSAAVLHSAEALAAKYGLPGNRQGVIVARVSA